MEPAVQGALVGANAAIIGVVSSGAIQWGLKSFSILPSNQPNHRNHPTQ